MLFYLLNIFYFMFLSKGKISKCRFSRFQNQQLYFILYLGDPKCENEIPYVKAINRLLPNNIRMIASAEVPEDFDAR